MFKAAAIIPFQSFIFHIGIQHPSHTFQHLSTLERKAHSGGFKNLPSNAGDMGLIPGRGTKIPHATGQLSLRATTTEPMCHNY